MPTYEYKCQKCNAVLEVMQPMADDPLQVCGTHCTAAGRPGDGKVVKLISRVAAHTAGRRGELASDAAKGPAPSAGTEGHVCGPGCSHGKSADSSARCVGDLVRKKYGLD